MNLIFAVTAILLHIVVYADNVKRSCIVAKTDSITLVQPQQSLGHILSDNGTKIDYGSNNATRTIQVSNPVTFSTQHRSFSHHTTAPQYNLNRMNTDQLRWYFAAHGYTEGEILSHPGLYLNQAYLALAKQLPRYPEFVKKYHDRYRAYNSFREWWEWFNLRYHYGMKEQFARLYQECEEQRRAQKALDHKQRELRAQQEREAQKKKEARDRDAYICELQRVERILSDGSSFKSFSANYHKARLEKIQIAQQHPERKLRQLQTGQDALDFAAAYNLTEQQITRVTMNSYEYQLHSELVSHIHSAVGLQKEYAVHDQNIFIDALGQGIALGIKSNHLHNPEWATRWSDFCYEATEIIQGIGEGIVLGSYNTVDMVMNPIRTLVRIADGVRMLGSLTVRTVGTLARLNCLMEQGEYLQCATKVHAIGEQLVKIAINIKEATSQMSNREVAKHVTAFGTEWALTGQMFAMGHTLCSNLGQTIKRTIKFLKDEGAAGEFALATTDGVLFKASENLNKSGSCVRDIVRGTRTILEAVHAEYMAKLKTDIDILRIAFDCKVNGFGSFANKWIKINYEHVLGMEGLAWGRYGLAKINGFHHDCMNIIRKSGALEFIDQVVTETGFYKSKILYDGHYVDTKTFFPANWSREKVVSTIYDAYNDFIKSGVKPKQLPDGKLILQGLTNEGVTIEMIMTQKCKIVTAYPLL